MMQGSRQVRDPLLRLIYLSTMLVMTSFALFSTASNVAIKRWIPVAHALSSSTSARPTHHGRILVVGGGASGIFASIAAAEDNAAADVTVLEAGSKTLTKVKISGGGRCNVIHDSSKPVNELLQGYPRGRKELNGLLIKRFGPIQAQEWFEGRGVQLKTEDDGRMFPTTDSSQTIIDALLLSAEKSHVSIRTRCKVDSIQRNDDGFSVSIREKDGDQDKVERFDAVILATGSASVGYHLAQSLGHQLVPTVPSLFTLNAKLAVKEGSFLHGLSGVSVPLGRVSFRVPNENETNDDQQKKKRRQPKRKILMQEGPLLITHHGLSGPAALRLSAFGAREFAKCNYRGELLIHWAPQLGTTDQVTEMLWKVTSSNPKKTVSSVCPLFLRNDSGIAIPRRLWSALVSEAGFASDSIWGQAPKKLVQKLAMQICECPVEMTGKGTFKEEFVTAGGVSLKEIDMTNMQSKKCPGLFLCGELIDVDGVTGGFNFMNAWGTGFVAGKSAAEFCRVSKTEALS